MMNDVPFWKARPLAALNEAEWEALCDGCGRCCLNKLEDEDTAEIFWTNVACKLLDHTSCQCSSYADRHDYVPDCVKLDVQEVVNHEMTWLPPTCAYRLLSEGQDLYWWHYLVSGDRQTVHSAGISVRHRVISEALIPEDTLEDHICDWPGVIPDTRP